MELRVGDRIRVNEYLRPQRERSLEPPVEATLLALVGARCPPFTSKTRTDQSTLPLITPERSDSHVNGATQSKSITRLRSSSPTTVARFGASIEILVGLTLCITCQQCRGMHHVITD